MTIVVCVIGGGARKLDVNDVAPSTHRIETIGDDGRMRFTLYELEDLLRERKALRPADSYSVELFDDRERIQRKVMEEGFETCLEFGRPDRSHERIVSESADLVFHLLVGLVDCEVSLDEVVDELARRRG